MVPLELLTHVAQCIQSPALIKLIQRHHIGIIEHIDLLQLRSGPIFGRHYIQSHIAVFSDHGIALTDSAGLHHDQIITRHLQNAHSIVYVRTQRQVGLTGCHRTHVHTVVVDTIHSNAIAQQGTACFSFRWVDGNDGQLLLRKIREEPSHQLIHQTTFARAAGTCNAQNGGFDRLGLTAQIVQHGLILIGVIFSRRNQSRDVQFGLYARIQFLFFALKLRTSGIIGLHHQIIDHALQTHRPAIVGRINPRDAIIHEFFDLFRQNHTATTTKNLDVLGTSFLQQIIHVFEVLVVTALVAGHGNGVGILLNGGLHHLLHTAIVTQVNHFTTG